jgi:hypothetical protein
MTDHAAALRPVLLALASDPAMPLEVRKLAADAEGAEEIEAVLARTGRALVHAEAHITHAEHHAKQLREKLTEVMVETGAPSFSIGSHTIGTQETRRVRITDEAAVPLSFMVRPAPKPDTQAIKNAIEKGATVAGAELSNGSPSLFVRARSKT